jgi:SRSO17 transposase
MTLSHFLAQQFSAVKGWFFSDFNSALYRGLMLPIERKSVEPMAARLAPGEPAQAIRTGS